MRKGIFILFFAVLQLSVHAQEKSSLSGKVTDENHNPVKGASIRLLNTDKGSFSNVTGDFSIPEVYKGSYQVEVTAIGFAGISRTLSIEGNRTENFELA